MEVRPGYKRTEVGMLPEDWEVKKIGEISEVGRGRVISHREIDASLHSLYPVYSSQTSDEGIMGYIDTYDFEGEYVTWTTDGVNAGTVFYRDGRFNCTNVCGTIRLKKHDPLFVSKVLSTMAPRYVSRNLANPKLMNDVAKQIPVPLPPTVEEQRAIAAVLSDVDALITALDRLIAKKRAIKQGAMQQLLTGKTRLPGFSGEWEVRKLGDVSEIKTGKKNNEDKVDNGAYPFFVRSQTVERINTYSFDGEAVLVPGEGGIGSIFHYINGKFDYHQRVYKISDFSNDICGTFIYFCMLQSFGEQATRHSVKATVDSLCLPTFQEFEFIVPSLEEQRAIAAILSDMDAEIAALEARRDKTRALKQGMMQELLTGNIRLI